MRKTKTLKISEVLKDCLSENHLDQKIKISGIKRYWEQLMGKTIAGKTSNIYLKNRVLYISLDSSVLRNELIMMRSRLIRMMNEQMGGSYIDEVRIR